MKLIYPFILVVFFCACGSRCVLFNQKEKSDMEKIESDFKNASSSDYWSESTTYYRDITGLVEPEEFFKLMTECDSSLIIDARPPGDYSNAPRIKSAKMISGFRYLEAMLKGVDKEHQIMVYCATETRSPAVIRRLLNMGFTNVYELKGGLVLWEMKKLPMVNPDGSTYKYDDLSY